MIRSIRLQKIAIVVTFFSLKLSEVFLNHLVKSKAWHLFSFLIIIDDMIKIINIFLIFGLLIQRTMGQMF